MTRQEMQAMIRGIIHDEKHGGSVLDLTDVLDRLADVCDAIEPNRSAMQKELQAVFDSYGNNPINGLLKLMGLKIVNIEKMTLALDSEADNPNQLFDTLCSVDEARLRGTVADIARALQAYEEDRRERERALSDQLNGLIRRLDEASVEREQLLSDADAALHSVAGHCQRMLGRLAEDGGGDTSARLCEMLRDLDITVHWHDEGEPDGGAMFICLVVDEQESQCELPCMMKGGAVVCKGVHLVKPIVP